MAIVEQLERADELGAWTAPWHGRHGMPRNAATGNQYRGGNVLALWAAQLRNGYPTEHWGTYRQWAALGRQVQRGQRATHGIKWIDRGQGDDDGVEAGEASLRSVERRAFPVSFAIFNVAQTEPCEAFDGIPWQPPTVRSGPDAIPGCAAFFDAIGADITVGAPAYSPALDVIMLPPLEAFDDAEAFYATSAHEHVHWSGHSLRLARDLSGRFGSDAYAAEELIAELGASFLAALLGIETTPRADHAQYLASWLRVLRADPKALFSVATAAQRAADYLVDTSTTTRCATVGEVVAA
jgi:antirestriction protein ArdC